MYRPIERLLTALCASALLPLTVFADTVLYPDVGRNVTAAEVAKWDNDVRPDLAGLPKGQGTVAQGQVVWEAKCTCCHGVFGESNQVYNPISCGVQAQDLLSGRVANLLDKSYPARTTLMKLATVSTLWDYINRAMPWNAPKSLSTHEVYDVTAYLLHLDGIVADDFVLNENSMAQVQQRMPNRDGMNTRHHLWPGNEFAAAAVPDVTNVACMSACKTEVSITSSLPEHARDAHGNMADQNRLVGPQKGVNTSRATVGGKPADKASENTKAAADASGDVSVTYITAQPLLKTHRCLMCHMPDSKLIGPAFSEVAKKYPGQADYLAGKIVSGESGVWGSNPMLAQSLSAADAVTIARWLAAGARH